MKPTAWDLCLDITTRGGLHPRAFPNIHARRLELGIDITKRPDSGCTGRALHLWRHRHRSCGENRHPGPVCSRRSCLTGPHGANRLAIELAARMPRLCRGCNRGHPRAAEDRYPATAALGRKPSHRCRRGSGHLPQLGRVASLHGDYVGIVRTTSAWSVGRSTASGC